MNSGDVHNFRRGEFGVESIEIDELKGLIQISYGIKESGKKYVLIPMQNIEKIEFLDKEVMSAPIPEPHTKIEIANKSSKY